MSGVNDGWLCDVCLQAGTVGGGAMVVKRPALVDSKTSLPVYRQWTTSYAAQLAAVNTLQQIQSQPFISFPSKIRACIVRGS